ncbi:glycosyltransferase family 4 protein [Candidatus Bathyarchaeota archaeon]|nr:glycosyltransferase family 4 protein [Candidatus Bathyarchaeota archaeon]
MNLSSLKICFLCPQGGPHPAHKPWIESLSNFTNIKVIHIPRRIPYRLLLGYNITLSKRYDLAIVDGFTPSPMGWFMKKIGSCKKLAFITTSPAYMRFPRLFNFFLKDTDFIIATSSLTSSTIQKLFNFDDRQIAICYPIPDVSNFLKVKPSLDSQKISFLGSLIYTKGTDLLPKIITKVRTKLKEAELYVIGSGRLSEVEGMKVFGFVPRDEELLLLSKCSVYVHPARFEAFGASVVEAMAAGLIPIVTEMTGSKDLVVQVDPSLIVPVNVDAISEKIIEVLSISINEKKVLSEKAKRIAAEWSVKVRREFPRKIIEHLR